MKIQSLELFKIPPRWLYLKMTTDDGLVGWGEPIVEGRADTAAACVRELSEYVIGKNPNNIEDIWQELYRGGFYRGGPVLMSAISGIDQALWDIKGKRLGVPVYELLGGPVREKMRMYMHTGGATPAQAVADAQAKIAAGFTVLKMADIPPLEWIDNHAKVDRVIEIFAAVREALGTKVQIAYDIHGRAHKAMARILMKAFEPYRPMFVEEPVLAENNEALIELRQHCTIPIATGERMYTRWGFKSILASGAVDIVQPDCSHCGGIWELRKIAAMAEAYDVAVAPHCPLGPICLAASLQVDFCTPNAIVQESAVNLHLAAKSPMLATMVTPFELKDGFIHRTDKPGLGIEINEEAVREIAAKGHDWRCPVWRNEDGSVTEW